MPHVITNLCMREGSCITRCPVECIVPGNPQNLYPQYYIDPETCIDCGACVSECPFHAIFPREEVPHTYKARGHERLNMPEGTTGFDEEYNGENLDGDAVTLKSTRTLTAGEVVDLTPSIEANAAFFNDGPGYDAARP